MKEKELNELMHELCVRDGKIDSSDGNTHSQHWAFLLENERRICCCLCEEKIYEGNKSASEHCRLIFQHAQIHLEKFGAWI